MNAGRTARDRARAELTQEIKDTARRQLATDGAERLSLRAVSRELGMVSSALYRYFPSRDDLLTALIIDAYDALGSAVEKAAAGVLGGGVPGAGVDGVPGAGVERAPARAGAERAPASAGAGAPREAWLAASRAVRRWAVEHPHEYALIYGSPVPGYSAPQSTVQPASRVAVCLLGVLQRAQEAGVLVVPGEAAEPSDALVAQLQPLEEFAPGVPRAVLLRTGMIWAQLFGLVSFELFGQFVGTFDPADELFEAAIASHAAFLGLGEGVRER
ncbi:TetR/AcrR family transcriptional regulator [Kribbella italica]|uniref:AcrR family transcriptional regulator n=1 Tax=Kribbella italica TaxID=1540520 RepID=A0A7W9MXT1_9ACTN|nr:TetR/AcrR family transcriptional regulator [Kribbella italica]MBB5839403.1 AcrR family transcriptional regulator [Kribbella italica]